MKVLILIEGGRGIGFGHIGRCLSLYGSLEEKGVIPKLLVHGDNSIKDILENKNYEIYNWLKNVEKVLDLARKTDMVIIDSYLATSDFYEKVSKTTGFPVYLDDNKRIDYPRGTVLNGNIYAKNLDYPRKRYIRYLLGAKYIPLRKEFRKTRLRVIKKDARSILLTTGGDDIKNIIPKVLRMLTRIYPRVNKKVIISRAFGNTREIEKSTDKMTSLIYYPSPKDLRDWMLFSDIAISGSGQTLYELASLGTPTIGICIGQDQRNNHMAFSDYGLCLNAGYAGSPGMLTSLKNNLSNLFDNTKLRETMSCKQRELIDGQGAKRVVDELLSRYYKSRQ